MSGHTPGPWIVDHAEGQMPVGVATAAQFPICEMFPGIIGWTAPEPVAVKLANARLIAAAPELLFALQEARAWHAGDKWRQSESPAQIRRWQQHMDLIQSAIAKATGASA